MKRLRGSISEKLVCSWKSLRMRRHLIWVFPFSAHTKPTITGIKLKVDYPIQYQPAFCRLFFMVRPAGRFYSVVEVHYGPVKGNH
jgi:hypothetical protein